MRIKKKIYSGTQASLQTSAEVVQASLNPQWIQKNIPRIGGLLIALSECSKLMNRLAAEHWHKFPWLLTYQITWSNSYSLLIKISIRLFWNKHRRYSFQPQSYVNISVQLSRDNWASLTPTVKLRNSRRLSLCFVLLLAIGYYNRSRKELFECQRWFLLIYFFCFN